MFNCSTRFGVSRAAPLVGGAVGHANGAAAAAQTGSQLSEQRKRGARAAPDHRQ